MTLKARIFVAIFLVAVFGIQASANAMTECQTSVSKHYAGDGGAITLVFDNGMAVYLLPSNPDLKNILAQATTALVTNKNVILRLQADNVPCNSSSDYRGDVAGFWLLK